MKNKLNLIALLFVLGTACFGGKVAKIQEQIRKNNKEIEENKKPTGLLTRMVPESTRKLRIKNLEEENKKLNEQLKSTLPKKITLKKVSINNAVGYDEIWFDWADVRLKFNGKFITETIKNNNDPLFDNLEVELDIDKKNTIDVLDEDISSYQRMGEIMLDFTKEFSDKPGTVTRTLEDEVKVQTTKGFKWKVEVEITY